MIYIYIALTPRIWVNLPVFRNGPAATQNRKNSCKEGEADEKEANINPERHAVDAVAQPLVEEEPAKLERPQQDRVDHPAEELCLRPFDTQVVLVAGGVERRALLIGQAGAEGFCG